MPRSTRDEKSSVTLTTTPQISEHDLYGDGEQRQ